MEKIKNSHSQIYNPAEVAIQTREPYNKNTLWIHPHNSIIDVKIYDLGWKVIASTEDKGLSKTSSEQVETSIDSLRQEFSNKFEKFLGKSSADYALLLSQKRKFEAKINELEQQIQKLNKKITTLVAARNING